MTRSGMANGPCEVVDLVPTEDDAVEVTCGLPGRPLVETDTLTGYQRLRVVCDAHAGELPS